MTVLLFLVGVPLAVIALVFVLVFASSSRSAKRYRPGRPYNYVPVWFLARPATDGPSGAKEIESGSDERALEAVADRQGIVGGASDRW